MIEAVHLSATPFFPGTHYRAGLVVPSAQPLELYEVLITDVGPETWVRFRFLAPEIGTHTGGKAFAEVEADFEHLCQTLVLPYIADYSLEPDAVVLTMLSQPVEFGTSDADATQYVEVFRIEGNDCIWEGL